MHVTSLHAEECLSLRTYLFNWWWHGRIDPVKRYYHNQKSITLSERNKMEMKSLISLQKMKPNILRPHHTHTFSLTPIMIIISHPSLTLARTLIPFASQFSQRLLISLAFDLFIFTLFSLYFFVHLLPFYIPYFHSFLSQIVRICRSIDFVSCVCVCVNAMSATYL